MAFIELSSATIINTDQIIQVYRIAPGFDQVHMVGGYKLDVGPDDSAKVRGVLLDDGTIYRSLSEQFEGFTKKDSANAFEKPKPRRGRPPGSKNKPK